MKSTVFTAATLTLTVTLAVAGCSKAKSEEGPSSSTASPPSSSAAAATTSRPAPTGAVTAQGEPIAGVSPAGKPTEGSFQEVSKQDYSFSLPPKAQLVGQAATLTSYELKTPAGTLHLGTESDKLPTSFDAYANSFVKAYGQAPRLVVQKVEWPGAEEGVLIEGGYAPGAASTGLLNRHLILKKGDRYFSLYTSGLEGAYAPASVDAIFSSFTLK